MRAENDVSIRVNTASKISRALNLSVADLIENPPVPLGAGGIESGEAVETPEVININVERAELERHLNAIEQGEPGATEALRRLLTRENA